SEPTRFYGQLVGAVQAHRPEVPVARGEQRQVICMPPVQTVSQTESVLVLQLSPEEVPVGQLPLPASLVVPASAPHRAAVHLSMSWLSQVQESRNPVFMQGPSQVSPAEQASPARQALPPAPPAPAWPPAPA